MFQSYLPNSYPSYYFLRGWKLEDSKRQVGVGGEKLENFQLTALRKGTTGNNPVKKASSQRINIYNNNIVVTLTPSMTVSKST